MKKKKGVSLIVLVITIIVMIILASAVINSLNNNGIINRANEAVRKTNESEINHIVQVAWADAYISGATTQEEFESAVNEALQTNNVDMRDFVAIVTTSGVTLKNKDNVWLQDGLTITKGTTTLYAGDLIQYNAGVTGYTGEWKVLGAENGNLLIMSTEDVDTLTLYGVKGGTYRGVTYEYGYLNGISGLNKTCEPYSKGIGAIGARSIKIEDIEKLTGFDPTGSGQGTYNEYGLDITFSWDGTSDEPVMTSSSINTKAINHPDGFTYLYGINVKTSPVASEAKEITTIKMTYYTGDGNGLKTRSPEAYKMIFNEDDLTYHLASKCTLFEAQVMYCYRSVMFNSIMAGSTGLFDSLGNEMTDTDGVRAVVKLSSDITIGAKDATNGWSYSI